MLSVISIENPSYALTTATINVEATVASACNFTASSYTLNFGNYLQPSTQPLAVASEISFSCASSGETNISFSLSGGNSGNANTRYMTTTGGLSQLNYFIYQPTSIPTPPTTPGTCPSPGAGGTIWGDGTNGSPLNVPISGFSAGTVYNINMCGQIPASQLLPSGAYTDTLTMTMTVT